MSWKDASELGVTQFVKMLLLGPPKLGKTTCAIATSPKPVCVINCDAHPQSALFGAYRRTSEFQWCAVRTWKQMQQAMIAAAEAVETGGYKTIVLGPLSAFSDPLKKECFRQTRTGSGAEDGRKAWPLYHERLTHIVNFFMALPCHFVCESHYQESFGEEVEGQAPKTGAGIMPLLYGASRQAIPGMFQDVVLMDMRKGERIFRCAPTGVWGPGSRSVEEKELPASIRRFIKAMSLQKVTEKPSTK